jgi:outer membrane protein OmpA-like peptidoglycan-associated protein
MPLQDDSDLRTAAVVLTLVVVLAVGMAVGVGFQVAGRVVPVRTVEVQQPMTDTQSPTDAAKVAGTSAEAAEDASVEVDAGVVTFYFAPGRADMPAGAVDALSEAIAAARQGRRLVLAGYHDATGDPLKNAELARQRAWVVREALLRAGVAASRVEIRKPAEAVDSSNAAQARRVDVMIGD